MAQKRQKIRRAIVDKLVLEAGCKCANPGCATRRTHIHHIKEWAIFKTHDAQHMVAICPSCHDAVHNGAISISDETIYSWKSIKRLPTNRDYLYIEPAKNPSLLLGCADLGFSGENVVFELDENNKLSFQTRDSEILSLDLKLATRTGEELISIRGNHVKFSENSGVRYEQVPGNIKVTAPSGNYLPGQILSYLRRVEPSLIENERLAVLEIGVVAPARVRVKGVWVRDKNSLGDGIIIVSETKIYQIPPYGPAVIYSDNFLASGYASGVKSFTLGFGLPSSFTR